MNDTGEPSDQDDFSRDRVRDLYWQEIVQLKVSAEYVKRYRDRLSTHLVRIAIVRAVISVAALAALFADLGYAKAWASVIVASQVMEAGLSALPLSLRHKGLTSLEVVLDAMLADAEFDWQNIELDKADAREINIRWHSLKKQYIAAIAKHLTTDLPRNEKLFRLAQDEATAYFKATYDARSEP